METTTKTNIKTKTLIGIIAVASFGIALASVIKLPGNTGSAGSKCQNPPTCSAGTLLQTSGMSNGCPVYTCGKAQCALPPNCGTDKYSIVTSTNSTGCKVYTCVNCPTKPSCSSGGPVVNGTDNNGCKKYTCPIPSVQQGK